MEKGGIKNAKHIVGLLKTIISQIEQTKDPNNQKTDHQRVVDLVLFDGASNVQNAAKLVSVTHPRITVVHGAVQGNIHKNASVPIFIPVFEAV